MPPATMPFASSMPIPKSAMCIDRPCPCSSWPTAVQLGHHAVEVGALGVQWPWPRCVEMMRSAERTAHADRRLLADIAMHDAIDLAGG
jgi:hypothetical protein